MLGDKALKKIKIYSFINNITLIAIIKSIENNIHTLAKVYNQIDKNWKVK